MSSNFVPLTQRKRLKKANRLSQRTGLNALNHIHNAAAAAAGVCSRVHLRTRSTPNPLSDLQCALLISRWHFSSPLWHREVFRLHGPSVNSLEGVDSGSPPRRRSIRLRVGESRIPTTAGDRDDKAKQTYIRRIAAKPNRVTERSWVYTWSRTLPSAPVPPLISRLSLCGLTGRSAPVNLIYPLFRLCLPPASHIFSTWQNLNLSADGVHCCFLWPVNGKRKGWGGRGSFYSISDGCGKTKWCSGQCERVYSMYVLEPNAPTLLRMSLLMMRPLPSNHNNLEFKARFGFDVRGLCRRGVDSARSGFCSEPVYVDFPWLFSRYSAFPPQVTAGMNGWVSAEAQRWTS